MAGLLTAILIVEAGLCWISWELFFHLLPGLPILTNGALYIVFREKMHYDMPPGVRRPEQNRAYVSGLMGFSFTSLLALTVVDAKVAMPTFYPAYYMLLSFMSFLVAYNFQSYKRREWHELLSGALIQAATLSLLLSLVSIFESTRQELLHKNLFAALALGVWLLDHLIRLNINRQNYERLKPPVKRGREANLISNK